MIRRRLPPLLPCPRRGLRCVLLSVLAVAAARAQRTLPDPWGVPVAPLRLTDVGGEWGVQFDAFGERQSLDDGGADFEFTNRTWQEYVLYRLRGYAYHPRFLEFNGRLKLGLMQQQFDQTDAGGGLFDGGRRRNTFLNAYDLYLHFFQQHPLSFTLFAQRDRSAVLEIFTDRVLLETESWGAAAHWKRGPLPIDVSYVESRLREEGFDSRSETTTRAFDTSIRHALGRWMLSELRYRYLDYTQDFRGEGGFFEVRRRTELTSHDLSFSNTIFLDEDRRNTLGSFVRYYDQSGSQELRSWQWQERLSLEHTPNLTSYYLASYLRNELDRATIETLRGEAGFDHRLYRSLQTHVDVHGRRSTFDGLTDSELGATLRLGYTKRTPWGVLTAGYGRTLDRVERLGRSGRAIVLDEPLAIDDVQTRLLRQPNIVPNSIVVTDTAGLTVYTENLDYRVERIGDRTGLRLIPGGALAAGQTVLVDYDFEIEGDLTYLSDEQDYHLRFDFERLLPGLALYVRRRELTPRDVRDSGRTILAFTDRLLGAQWTWRPSGDHAPARWARLLADEVILTQEFQTYRSTSSDYDQTASRIEGRRSFENGLRWAWHGGLIEIDYGDEGGRGDGEDRSRIAYAGTSLSGRLRERGFWEVEARLNRETGRTEETFAGLLGKVGWRWRKLRIEAGGRLEQRERFNSTLDRYHVFLQVAREF